jgi:hypothetical protein
MSEKDAVIRSIYYDKDDGFDSIQNTYKKANKVLSSITINDVKTFLDKQKSRQTKAHRGFNSYVAPKALHEIQIDIAVFTESASDNNGFKYALVAVDAFSKYIWAVPIKNKQPTESVRAFNQILNHIGTPTQIFHDNEGAWNSKEFTSILNNRNIKQIITSSPPPFAERAIQEMKNMIHTRLDALDMKKEEWVDLLPSVVKKYNGREHGSTGMSPNDAKKDENSMQVYLNIRKHATFKRNYPPLHVGDTVRTRIKPHTFKKGHDSSWSKEVYKITFIENNQYLLDDKHIRKRVWPRHDLLKIEGAEGKDG